MPGMTSPAASDRHLSRFEKTPENAASDGFVYVKHNAVLHYAVSRAYSNFAREEYQQSLRLKRRGVSPTQPYGGLLVLSITMKHSVLK